MYIFFFRFSSIIGYYKILSMVPCAIQGSVTENEVWLLAAQKPIKRDLPAGTVVKNPSANAGDTGSSPGTGRSHMPRSN